jgi:excinuclease ABC subunit C
MTSQELLKKDLPDLPGVYIFRDSVKDILYIGKATSLRDRTRSYFATDLIHTRGSRIVDMVTLATDVDVIVTDSVLEALILEAHLIQKHLPKYNSFGKDNKSWNYVVITKEDFPKVITIRGRTLDLAYPKKNIKYVFGPFPHGTQLRSALKIIRRIFPYSDDKCTPKEYWIAQGKPEKVRPCFNYQIGLCPGVCTGEISKQDYGRIINHLRLFFEGKKSELIKSLEREMKQYAKAQEFEKAETTKRTIFALNHIQDISLIKEEKELEREEDQLSRKETGENRMIFRIEAYDIAHISGTSQVGVMVVVEDNEPAKSEYRKFKIRTQKGANDVGSLKEVLRRRLNHPEWQLPSLIVVDGGQAQINAANEILRERELDIDVVSVVKDERHKPRDVMGSETFSKSEEYKKAIILANSEAHRFAITYHRHLRGRLK